jgi:hypothetical protein
LSKTSKQKTNKQANPRVRATYRDLESTQLHQIIQFLKSVYNVTLRLFHLFTKAVITLENAISAGRLFQTDNQ